MSMKKILCISMAVACIALVAIAANNPVDWAVSIRYWYHENVSTNVPPIKNICTVINRGNSYKIENWNVPGHAEPTKLWLKNHEADALIWNKEEKDTALSDYTQWEPRHYAMAELLRKNMTPVPSTNDMILLIDAELQAQ